MKNPIKSYVPIIRWRPAETRALKHLFSKDRTNVTPLFEFILPPPTIEEEVEKIPVVLVDTRFNSDDKPNYKHAILVSDIQSLLKQAKNK